MNLLRRYWFELEQGRPIGVTAYSYDDAVSLIRSAVFRDREMPLVVNVIENVDVSTLDANHVVPNIGVCSRRGVWYPNLNS